MTSEEDQGYVHPSFRTQGPLRLQVGSEEWIPPPERIRIQENLHTALVTARVGKVIGGDTLEYPNEDSVRSTIQVEVYELEAGVRVLRHALRQLRVPSATWIWQFEPEEVCYEIWFDEDHPPKWGW